MIKNIMMIFSYSERAENLSPDRAQIDIRAQVDSSSS